MPRGHIQRRDNGTFRVFVDAGRDPFMSKRRQLTATAKTRPEAERLLTRLLAQVDEGHQPATGATVSHLLRRWLDVADLEMTSRLVNAGYITRDIEPALGDIRLSKLTPDISGPGVAWADGPWPPAPCVRSTSSCKRRSGMPSAGAGSPATPPS